MTADELRIADYGCGPGRNSMVAFRAILEEIFSHRPDMPVVCGHNDKADNDWNGLIASVTGTNGYLDLSENIRVETLVGSFFRQVASSRHDRPRHVFDGGSLVRSRPDASFARHRVLFPHRGRHPSSPGRDRRRQLDGVPQTTVRGRLSRAAGSWSRSSPRYADDSAPGGFVTSGQPHYPILWDIAEGMAAEGLFDGSLLENFLVPIYWRTVDEIRAPLERDARIWPKPSN